MTFAVPAVLLVLLADVAAYAANEATRLHALLRLPRMLCVSNRTALPGRRPASFWAFDLLQPEHLVTSWWLPPAWLAALRLATLAYFGATFVVEGLQAGGYPRPAGVWLTWYTNDTFLLYGATAALGAALSLAHLARLRWPGAEGLLPERVALADGEEAGAQRGAPPGALASCEPQWRWWERAYCLMYATNAAATLFLSGFYWAFVYKGGTVKPDNVLKHAVNNLPLLADVALSRVPFVSYHYLALLWYGTAYLVYMWLLHAAGVSWRYGVLDWAKPSSLLYYALLPLLTLCAFFFWYGVATAREALGGRYEPVAQMQPAVHDARERGLSKHGGHLAANKHAAGEADVELQAVSDTVRLVDAAEPPGQRYG